MKEEAIRIVAFLVVMLLLPIISFLCLKWGTFGYFKGKELTKKENGKDEE